VAELNWWLMVWDMNPAWKGGHGGAEETAAIMAIDPKLVDLSEIESDASITDISAEIRGTGFTSVEFKGVTVNVPRLTPAVTNNGWIGRTIPGWRTPLGEPRCSKPARSTSRTLPRRSGRQSCPDERKESKKWTG
jgi:hypothetical protein